MIIPVSSSRRIREALSTSIQQLGPEIDHEGQIVAIVLADTFEAAREAAHRVRVTYAGQRRSQRSARRA